jgi:hypothetical protein
MGGKGVQGRSVNGPQESVPRTLPGCERAPKVLRTLTDEFSSAILRVVRCDTEEECVEHLASGVGMA